MKTGLQALVSKAGAVVGSITPIPAELGPPPHCRAGMVFVDMEDGHTYLSVYNADELDEDAMKTFALEAHAQVMERGLWPAESIQ